MYEIGFYNILRLGFFLKHSLLSLSYIDKAMGKWKFLYVNHSTKEFSSLDPY